MPSLQAAANRSACGHCTCPLAKLNGHRAQLLAMGRFLQLPKKSVLCEQGTSVGGVYIVCTGLLKLVQRTVEGRQQLLAIAGPSDVLGSDALLELDVLDHFAQALTNCRLFFLSKTERKSALNFPEFSQAVLQRVSQALKARQQHLHQVLCCGVRERLVRSLHYLASQFGQRDEQALELDFRLTNEEWAAWVGSTPQTVSSELNALQRQGFFKRSGRGLILTQSTEAP